MASIKIDVRRRSALGDPGVGKTVAVQQALYLLPSRVPVWGRWPG
ncbi:hypothetical protein [Streptomyces sp. NPDC002676]